MRKKLELLLRHLKCLTSKLCYILEMLEYKFSIYVVINYPAGNSFKIHLQVATKYLLNIFQIWAQQPLFTGVLSSFFNKDINVIHISIIIQLWPNMTLHLW